MNFDLDGVDTLLHSMGINIIDIRGKDAQAIMIHVIGEYLEGGEDALRCLFHDLAEEYDD